MSSKFLHTMRERAHLESALSNGLMLRRHPVDFNPADTDEQWNRILEAVLPLLRQKLHQLGRPLDQLSDTRRTTLLSGLGRVRGQIPMLCFTEVPEGRSLHLHYLNFGAYGLVASRNWLERNGGDRVIYVGQDAAVSTRLHRIIASHHIAGIHLAHIASLDETQPVYDNASMSLALDLLAYVETRQNILEAEWRIAGDHGYMGGSHNEGRRIPIELNDVECITVQCDTDVEEIRQVVEELGRRNGITSVPQVLVQPNTFWDENGFSLLQRQNIEAQ